ncbi:TonB-dependent receptor [Echinicola strongylocentroti]|uniref:TonB-dependent receptor n=2 Tax=Echinicola strongylocentroti TaxID=1795355 RepID=A0A2Z4IRQ4_9BACT|nr:TonB-dependent receptor [Echinicola strongylocentroti]
MMVKMGYPTYTFDAPLEQRDVFLGKRKPESVFRDTVIADKSLKTYDLEGVTISDEGLGREKEESSNIAFIKQDYIREHRGGSLMKSLEKLPGISTIGIGSGASKPLIRGLGFNQVMVVTNGIKHEGQQWGADHGLEVDQYAVDELVIVKGPASIRYGSDAIAGVVDIRDHSVPEKGEIGSTLSFGAKSNNGWLGTSVNTFGRMGHWYYDARVTYTDYGDFRVPADTVYVYDFGVSLDNNRVRNTAGREMDWTARIGYVSERFRNSISLSRVATKSGFFANAHGLEPRNVDEELHDQSGSDMLLPRQEVQHYKAIDRLSYRFANHLLEADVGFQFNKRKEWSQYVNHGFMPPNYPAELQAPSTLERAFDKKVYSLNLRDEWFLDRHQLQLGLSGELQKNEIGGWGFLIPGFTQRSIGFYALDKLKINKEWRVQAAARLDHSHIQIDSYQDWFPSTEEEVAGPEDYLFRAEETSRTFNSLVWSVGFNYVPGQWSFKGNVGTSFRVPIAKELAANGVNYHYYRFEKGDADLSPERSFQVDLGAAWEHEKWNVTFSPFFNYFSNYIYLNPSAEYDYLYGAGNQVFYYTQARVSRYGAELSLLHRINNSFEVQLQGEYVYSEQLNGDKKGYTLPFSPPPSLLANATYKPALDFGMGAPYLALDFRVTAKQQNIVPPEKITPGYRVVDLRMGGQFRVFKLPLKADIQVRNLLNTRYMSHTSFYRLINLPEQGRSINVSFQLEI